MVEQPGGYTYPDRHKYPDTPGEYVVVTKQSAPRIPHNIVPEYELKRHGQTDPYNANGKRLSGRFEPPDAGERQDVDPEEYDCGECGNLMGA